MMHGLCTRRKMKLVPLALSSRTAANRAITNATNDAYLRERESKMQWLQAAGVRFLDLLADLSWGVTRQRSSEQSSQPHLEVRYGSSRLASELPDRNLVYSTSWNDSICSSTRLFVGANVSLKC